jgi:hypothetical protein
VIASGLLLQTLGFYWVALNASAGASYLELALPLLVAGVGISMALPTVPTAVLSTVAPEEMGKASGVNTMNDSQNYDDRMTRQKSDADLPSWLVTDVRLKR